MLLSGARAAWATLARSGVAHSDDLAIVKSLAGPLAHGGLAARWLEP
jgi:hypothetical protein